MSRLRKHIELSVDHADLGALIDPARQRRSDALVVRIDGDGIRAHNRSTSSDSPPHLRGHVAQRGDGVAVAGVVREAFGEAFWSRGYAFATLLLTGIGVIGVIGLAHRDTKVYLLPLLIGVLGAPLCLVLAVVFHRRRRPTFERQCDELVTNLREYLSRSGAA